MRRTSWSTFLALVTLVSVAALGCGPGFEPVARLTRLRVLAIGNDPVNPIPGEVSRSLWNWNCRAGGRATTMRSASIFTTPGNGITADR